MTTVPTQAAGQKVRNSNSQRTKLGELRLSRQQCFRQAATFATYMFTFLLACDGESSRLRRSSSFPGRELRTAVR